MEKLETFKGRIIYGKPDPKPFTPELISALWEEMYSSHLRVIIPCPYCSSSNARTNPTCVQCGGPMGNA